MIVAPAVDLRGGRCVQLVGGVPGSEQVSLPDPVAVAERWWETGFGTLHVVDLDAALGDGDNQEVIRRVLHSTEADTQVGGGLRSEAAVGSVLDLGADRAIVGTRAVEDAAWLESTAEAFPNRLVVAADVRGQRVLTRGWQEDSALRLDDFMDRLRDLPLAGLLVTDVGREGKLEGVDAEHVRAVVTQAAHPVWISGGVTDANDLEILASAGAHGAVVGMALYQERMDAAQVAERYGR